MLFSISGTVAPTLSELWCLCSLTLRSPAVPSETLQLWRSGIAGPCQAAAPQSTWGRGGERRDGSREQPLATGQHTWKTNSTIPWLWLSKAFCRILEYTGGSEISPGFCISCFSFVCCNTVYCNSSTGLPQLLGNNINPAYLNHVTKRGLN